MGKLFDVSLVFSSIPELLTKLPITLELAVVSMLIGLGLGLVMAIIKMKKIRVLTQITNLLISLLRGTPVIVQLYVAFFGIPMMFKAINQQFGTNLAVANISGFVYAMIALGLNQSGFMAEIIRSALQSVDPGQIEAAHALGMTYPQTLRRIILPEAFEVALPTLGNSFISIIKGTSLAFTCAVVEITAQGQIIGGRTYRYFEVYVSLAIIYWLVTLVIEQIIRDREEHGTFRDLKDFLERLSGKEVNKRAVENFIKSGAFDSLKGTRKQFMIIYVQIMDQVAQNKKNSLAGQMSLFDIVDDEQKKEFEVTLPDVGEYQKETMLAFEKEVLGVYISGHPLEEYEEKWRKSISATTLDFQLDEETGRTKVRDGSREIIGGMITSKTIKYTKKNQTMAFITVEDLLGTVEVVIFPQSYEKSQQYLQEDSKVFVRGRVSEEDDNASKLICEEVIPFDMTKKELWIQYADKQSYLQDEQNLFRMLAESEGEDQVVIFCKAERAVKRLPKNANIQVEPGILSRLTNYFGEDCVKVIEKPIEMKG